MGEIGDDQAMQYTDQAASQAQNYNNKQVQETEPQKGANSTKPVKSDSLPDPKGTANKGSFYEQILRKTIESDPTALKMLAELKVDPAPSKH